MARSRCFVAAAFLIAAFAGCTGTPTDAPQPAVAQKTAGERPQTAASRVTPASLDRTTTTHSHASAAQEPTDQCESTSDSGNAKLTPFNLFAPPRDHLPVVRQSGNREKNDPIRLIGFVDVRSKQALLAFNGEIHGLEVGETYGGVEVIDIEPPKVTLQRGKERWITTLFDQPIVNRGADSMRGHDSGGGPRVTVGQSQEGVSRLRGANPMENSPWPHLPNAAAVPNQIAPSLPFPSLPGAMGDSANPIPFPPLPQFPGADQSGN